MGNVSECVKNNLKNHYEEISDKLINLMCKSEKRYFAYIVEYDTELCNHEGYTCQINYKYFDDENYIYLLRQRGYIVIDIYNAW